MPTIAQHRELTAQRVIRNIIKSMRERNSAPVNYLFGTDGECNSPQAMFEKLVQLCRYQMDEAIFLCAYDKEDQPNPLRPFQLNAMDSKTMTIGFTYVHPVTKKERRVQGMKITRFLTHHIHPKMDNDTVKLVAVQLQETLKPFTFFYSACTEDFVPLFRLMRIGSLEDRENEYDDRFIASCMDKPSAYYRRPRNNVENPSPRQGIHNTNENSLYLEDGDDYVHPVECYKGCEADNVVLGLIFRGEHSIESLQKRLETDRAFELFRDSWGRGLGQFDPPTSCLYVGKGYDRDHGDRGRTWRNHIDTFNVTNCWVKRVSNPLQGVTIYPVVNHDDCGHVVCAYIDPCNHIQIEEGNEDGSVALIPKSKNMHEAQYNAEWQTGNLRLRDSAFHDVIRRHHEGDEDDDRDVEGFHCACCHEFIEGEPECYPHERTGMGGICGGCEEDFSHALCYNDEGVFPIDDTTYSDFHGCSVLLEDASLMVVEDNPNESCCNIDYVVDGSSISNRSVQLSETVEDIEHEADYADEYLVVRTDDDRTYLRHAQAHLYFECAISGEFYSRHNTPFVVNQDGTFNALVNLQQTYLVRGA